jgi:NAD+ synthase
MPHNRGELASLNSIAAEMNDTERIRTLRADLVDWLRGMLRGTGAKGFVFGMSGGVDSNVTALLAKEAAGEHHLGLIMPIHGDQRERADAERLAREHGINVRDVDITAPFDKMLGLLPAGDDLARTNFKARLRMSLLYYYANVLQYLVIGTINRAEFTIGYFAKYGSYGDLLPLTRLLKRDIRALALELGMAEDLALKKASGCVSSVQNAEDEWGISEEELDEIVANWDSPETGVADLKALRLRRLFNAAEHKRRYPPVFVPRLG